MTDLKIQNQSRIQGVVAQILNARELVINRGASDGVTTGMKFKVLAESPLEIKDPDTGELIGVVDREKIRVQAAEIGQRMTVCRTFRTRRVEAGPLYYLKMGTLSGLNLFNSDPPKDVTETLDAADSSLPPPLAPEESFVKIRDRVVEVDE